VALARQQQHGERQDVLTALAQGRELDREHVETVEQVLAEASGRDLFSQATIRRGEHADIERHRRTGAEPLHLTLLQHAQQLGLQADGHLRDLVEQQRAALRLAELPRVRGERAGKCTALPAEQQRLEHGLRDGRAVHRDERPAGPLRLPVHVLREHLLAGTRLAAQQHRAVGRGDTSREVERVQRCRCLRDQLALAGAIRQSDRSGPVCGFQHVPGDGTSRY